MLLVHALEAVARRQPNSLALTWRASRWTYADLLAGIAIVERAIERRRPTRGTRIALLLRNCPHYVAAYYGTLASGCIAVPLNVHERAPVLVRQLEHSGAKILVGDSGHAEWHHVAAGVAHLPIDVIGLRLDGNESVAALGSALEATSAGVSDLASGDVGEHELASIIYTSGTTGHPKGVMLSHGNLHANADAIIRSLDLSKRDHTLCVLPFYFSYGNSVLHSHLLCGARLTLEDNFAFPRLMLQRIQDEGISGFAGVPSTFALLLGRHRLEDFDLSRLRYVTQAGGPMPRPLLEELRKRLRGARIFVMYGQTEATARLTCLPPEDLDRKPGSVGVPVTGVEIDIREDGKSLPPCGVGEIFVRGPNVMLGYWNDPAASADVLRDGWLRTRDLGYLDQDGYLYLVGRATDMIKTGAFRVSPQEIEEVIAAIEGVEDAAVVAIPDEILGQAVKAVVVPRPEAHLSVMAIKAHCLANLASYKVPKTVEFVTALPRTSSGKVQRFKLAGADSTHDT
jgi:long-chain acyl-CoA synthetase